jgi:hypothetical protein
VASTGRRVEVCGGTLRSSVATMFLCRGQVREWIFSEVQRTRY